MAKTKIIGKVIRISDQRRTIAVEFTRLKREKIYGKVLKVSGKLLAQSKLPVEIGDIAEVVETAPKSARKSWELSRVINPVRDNGISSNGVK
jgi:ribosomal protein S17